MIRFGLQQIITLDMDEVLRPNGETGVYLQSAHAPTVFCAAERDGLH
jgi:arginyl-tRNA synthetase